MARPSARAPRRRPRRRRRRRRRALRASGARPPRWRRGGRRLRGVRGRSGSEGRGARRPTGGTRARDARARRRARRDEGRRVGTGTPIRRGLVGGERRAPASFASSDRRPRARRRSASGFLLSAAEAGSRARGRTGRVIAPRVRLLHARDERGFEPGRVHPLRRERLAQLRDGHLPRRHRGPFGGAVASATRPGERGRE